MRRAITRDTKNHAVYPRPTIIPKAVAKRSGNLNFFFKRILSVQFLKVNKLADLPPCDLNLYVKVRKVSAFLTIPMVF